MEISVLRENQLGINLKNRMTEPAVRLLFERYDSEGVLNELTSLMAFIPSGHLPPIKLVLETHVTKEKPLYVYDIAQQMGVSSEVARQLAAATDMLWALSLIYDDMYDGDEQRAGVDTSWVRFGSEETEKAAQAGLEAVLIYLTEKFGKDAAKMTYESVMRGVASLGELKNITLDMPLEQFIENYNARAEFHAELPVRILQLVQSDLSEDTAEESIQALYSINRAGQLLNDVRDMDPGSTWQRQLYSDIRSGTPTIPLKYLWQSVDDDERKIINDLFSKGEINNDEASALAVMVERSGMQEHMYTMIDELYMSGYETFHSTYPSIRPDNAFDNWTEYKLNHLDRIIATKDRDE